ncbi:hypothetical protein AMJ80_04775 [bacterium SM23_31]|nr:MAG: hypothetical protein AMJ80_04775 [bacterium SM23_31]
MQSEIYYNSFIAKLKRLRNRELTVWSTVYFLKFIVISGTILLGLSLIESIFWLPARYRLVLSVFGAAAGSGLIIYYGFFAIRAMLGRDKRFSFEELSRKAGNTFPEIRDKLLNAIQVFTQLTRSKERYSPALIADTMNRVGSSFAAYDFTRSIDHGRLRRHLYLFGSFAGIFLIFILLTSGAVNRAAVRIFQPTKNFQIPYSFSLDVSPGSIEMIRNEPFRAVVSVSGKTPRSMSIFIKRESSSEYEKHDLTEAESGTYEFKVEKVKESFNYFIRGREGAGLFIGRNIDSEEYSVHVIYRPTVRNLKLHLEYPAYSFLGSRYLEDNIGDAAALKGTIIRAELTLNKPVKEASLHFTDGAAIPLTAGGVKSEGSFIVMKDTRYTIHLLDEDDITNSEPIEYRISAVQDAYPYIQFTIPGENTDLTEDKQILIGLKISDDFGLTQLMLGHRLVDREEAGTLLTPESIRNLLNDSLAFKYTDVPLEDKSGIIQDVYRLWDLENIQLFPEDRIIYFAEVYDNDGISGSKRTRTRTFTLRLPSIDELFEQAAQSQEIQEEKLSEIVEEGKELQEKLKELSHEFLQTNELEWEQKQKADEALKKQEDIKKRLEDIKKEIEELIEKFEKNDLLSAETLDKYKELQELLEELYSPELQTEMQKLQQSLENAAQMDQNRQNLDNFRNAQESFTEQVNRTLELLKRLQIEQMMDEVVTKAEHITETQQTINTKLDTLAQKSEAGQKQSELDKEKLARQEKDLVKNTDNLQNSIEKLLEKMIEQPDFPREKLSETLKDIEQKELQGQMLKLSQEMFKEAIKKSLDTGRQLEKELKEIEENLKEAQQEMTENQKEDILRAMRKSASDLLELSKKQEELKSESKSLTTNSDKFREIADKQNDITAGLLRIIGSLVNISEKSFFITPELGISLGEILSAMQGSIKMLEERNKAGSISNQDKSMQGLNESIIQLREIMKNVQESTGGTGFNEFVERMQQLAGQQQKLNQNTESLSQGGALSLEQQAAMQRLAQEQELIRKSLEQLQKEMQEPVNLKERLEQMGTDMREVIKDMKDLNITGRTLQLQEQILSRMLDAQRSIHRRDFSKKRVAETAKQYEGIDPGILPENLGEHKRYLEEDLIKALKEGYTRDFEVLIKNYFDSLNKKNIIIPVKKN